MEGFDFAGQHQYVLVLVVVVARRGALNDSEQGC
jgi:hypothetical protein